jgi:hypothetical protein
MGTLLIVLADSLRLLLLLLLARGLLGWCPIALMGRQHARHHTLLRRIL